MSTFVVGVDGSPNAAEALRWTCDEADVHGARVKAVMAWSWLDQTRIDPAAEFSPLYSEEDALAGLERAVRDAVGDREVELAVYCDLPVDGLREAAKDADLLVVGARGRGGFAGLRLGSVSERLVELCPCPVVVIRHVAPVAGGRVVVGVDGSDRARAALHWAAEEARVRGATLDVVHAWNIAYAVSGLYPATADVEAVRAGAQEVLDEALADPALRGLEVQGYLIPAGGAGALLERAEGAGIVVVGSRGHGRVIGALLGSVSRQVVHHAPCPVAVLPPPAK